MTELERYSGSGIMWGMDSPGGAKPTPDGEYVRHSQAAEIIAALTERLKNTEATMDSIIDERIEATKRAEAAEAKLAQYEDQKREAISIVWDRDGVFFQSWRQSYNGDGAKHAETIARNIGGSFMHIG